MFLEMDGSQKAVILTLTQGKNYNNLDEKNNKNKRISLRKWNSSMRVNQEWHDVRESICNVCCNVGIL